jgi:hypothetical protein
VPRLAPLFWIFSGVDLGCCHEIGDPYGCCGCTPRWGFYRNRLSCGEARDRVRHSGYKNVDTTECHGSTYTFEAIRKGRDVTVFVNAWTGALRLR